MQEQNTSESPSRYVPPKGWNQITDIEKLERMREVVKGYQKNVSRLQGELNKLNSHFEKHAHLEGKIVVPHSRYPELGGDICVEKSSNPQEVYF